MSYQDLREKNDKKNSLMDLFTEKKTYSLTSIDVTESTSPLSDTLVLSKVTDNLPLNQTPIPYYRSYYFTSHTGVYPIIMAAQALLVIQTRLLSLPSHPELVAPIEKLFSHELKAFQARASSLNCPTSEIAMAKRLLTQTIIPLLTAHSDLIVEKQAQFMSILLHLEQHPDQYPGLIDLACLLLSLGLMGESLSFNGCTQSVREIIDHLETKKKLSASVSSQPLTASNQQAFVSVASHFSLPLVKNNFFRLKKMGLLIGGMITATLILLNLLLESISGPLAHQLSTVLHVSML